MEKIAIVVGVLITILMGGYWFVSHRINQSTMIIEESARLGTKSTEAEYDVFGWLEREQQYFLVDNSEYRNAYLDSMKIPFESGMEACFKKAGEHGEQLVQKLYVNFWDTAIVLRPYEIDYLQVPGNSDLIEGNNYLFFTFLEGEKELHKMDVVSNSYLFDFMLHDDSFLEFCEEWKFYIKILERRGYQHPHLSFYNSVQEFYKENGHLMK